MKKLWLQWLEIYASVNAGSVGPPENYLQNQRKKRPAGKNTVILAEVSPTSLSRSK